MIRQARSRTRGIGQSHIAFGGGLDTVTPPLELRPGLCRVANNIECDLYGGYVTTAGYEASNGKPKPSAATYSIINITLTGSISVGNTVTGVTSGATGYVIAITSGYIAVTKITGTFVSGEVLNVAAAPQATTTSAAVVSGASTNLLNAQYNNLAADVYRADISAVPGSGSVTGVVRYNDVTYAFRNNAGGTATDIYKSSAAGWVNVPLFYELPFEQGVLMPPAEGSQVSQGSVTATVKRVALESGDWALNSAKGRLIVTTPSGGSFAQGYITGDPSVTAANGINWTTRISAADNIWTSIAYGAGLFVAVAGSGTGNRVMTSPDGITWKIRTSAADNEWYSVAYGNGIFVVVANLGGSGNRVMTSPDGITWTTRANAVDNQWRSVIYGNGLFVAVSTSGTGNRVMTSPDGITWTSRTSAADNNWLSVTYGNGLFVAVAGTGTGNRVMTSPDGITWTIRTSAADNTWVSVVYGNGLFVSVAFDGTGNRVMTSPDGITWTIRTSAADNQWRSVVYGAGLFVAVAGSGTGNRVMTSPDGITWTIRTSAADNNWTSIAYGGGLFVVVAASGSGNRVMTSPAIDNTIALATSTATAITLNPNGNYKFVTTNYTGSTTTKRVYGANGVDRGFEFDGTVLVPINTGMTTDTPSHVFSHKNHLFFSFGGSVQHSSPGFPYQWSPITGAGELAMGDAVTGFIAQPGSQTSGALTIFTRNRTATLYGSSSADWNLVTYREELGAISGTMQDVGLTIFLDDQGITSLQTVQEFGNFSHATLSNQIKTFFSGKSAITSCVARKKSQYRLYFTDGTGVYVTVGPGKYGASVVGMSTVTLPNKVVCIHSSEDSNGSEVILFGSDNGYVYEMEKGTSFDGAAIGWSFKLARDVLKAPRVEKRFSTVMLECSSAGYAQFNVDYSLGANTTLMPQPSPTSCSIDLSPGSKRDVEAVIHLVGQAESIALQLSGSSDYSYPVTFSGAIVNYAQRKLMR